MHKPVLLNEIVEIFNPQLGQTYIDATVNGGGHARAIAERVGKKGKVLGMDWDCELIQKLKAEGRKTNANNIIVTCGNYADIQSFARKHHLKNINGILFDCGFSSYHLAASRRGFSFLKDEPLDMRYNTHACELTAEKIINTWPVPAIADTIRNYGGERYARRIAEGIGRARRKKRICTTRELVAVILESIPHAAVRKGLHPATRTFQALRIAVNQELENLAAALPQTVPLLAIGGKIAVISFHSLEDRVVKQFFKKATVEEALRVIIKKPLTPSWHEIQINPRARSAKLRAAERVA